MLSPAPLPFAVSRMQLADIPDVMAIERSVFSLAWTTGTYRSELTTSTWSHYFVLRALRTDLPRLLAYGGIWKIDVTAHIPTIAAHPDYQHRHLGRYLLIHLLLHAASIGCEEATLEVRLSNHAAQALYANCGFEIMGRRRRYYSDNDEDALIMTRPSLLPADLEIERQNAEALVRADWTPPHAAESAPS